MCVCDLVPAVRFDFFEAKRRDLLAPARRAREHLVTETKENQNQQLAMATWWHEQNISCFWDLKDLSDSIFLCFVFASNTHIKIRCINMGWWNGWEQQATPFWSPRFGQSTAEIYDTTGWVPFLKKAPGWWFQALFITKALVGDGWPRSHKRVAWAKDTWLGRSDQWCGFPPRP